MREREAEREREREREREESWGSHCQRQSVRQVQRQIVRHHAASPYHRLTYPKERAGKVVKLRTDWVWSLVGLSQTSVSGFRMMHGETQAQHRNRSQ